MSLRERCRLPGSELALLLPADTLPATAEGFAVDHLEEKGRLRLSCELDEDLSDCGREATLPELFK